MAAFRLSLSPSFFFPFFSSSPLPPLPLSLYFNRPVSFCFHQHVPFDAFPLRNLHSQKSHAAGNIQVVLGPMFSGKTTELLRRVSRYAIARRKCVVIKYSKDNRYLENASTSTSQTLSSSEEDSLNNSHVVTHDRIRHAALCCSHLHDIHQSIKENDYDIIAIDEGQFFDDIVPFAESLASDGKTVIVSALSGTFQRKPFLNISDLLPLAEDIVHLNAVCTFCGSSAPFSLRTSEEEEVIVVGGSEKYVAVCRSCFEENSR